MSQSFRIALCTLFLVATVWAIAPTATAADLHTPASITENTITSEPNTSEVNTPSADTLFELNCAGCHANGGNIIRRGKNLKQKAMVRNGYDNVDAIADIITNGKGIMSSYSDRLNAEEISAIAQYVYAQSESGW